MTEAQEIALVHVALLGDECAHPRYGSRSLNGTLNVTVNAGYE